jgi:hypothetical protein
MAILQHHLVLFVLFWVNRTVSSFSSQNKKAALFQTFQFAPNGVCLSPEFFIEADDNNHGTIFTMRNVPGEGDCMFLAVALAAATSMGLGANDAMLRAISRETRAVVAQLLESPGNLHISQDHGVVAASELLLSAAQKEGLDPQDYLELLRKEGCQGGLYGGGPELTVLTNVLRRPISIYELKVSSPPIVTDKTQQTACHIVCKGVFGDGLFEDPCANISDSAVWSGVQPGAYSWHLHILVLDVSPSEKHACVLLPQTPTI